MEMNEPVSLNFAMRYLVNFSKVGAEVLVGRGLVRACGVAAATAATPPPRLPSQEHGAVLWTSPLHLPTWHPMHRLSSLPSVAIFHPQAAALSDTVHLVLTKDLPIQVGTLRRGWQGLSCEEQRGWWGVGGG